MKKPSLNANPVANNRLLSGERIAEFSNGVRSQSGFKGGLVSLRNQEDGTLDVHLYRLDAGVRVFVEDQHPADLVTELRTAEKALERATRSAELEPRSPAAVETADVLSRVRQTLRTLAEADSA